MLDEVMDQPLVMRAIKATTKAKIFKIKYDHGFKNTSETMEHILSDYEKYQKLKIEGISG